MGELHYTAICQTVLWCHFIRATARSKRFSRLFLSKTFMNIWHLIAIYYAFEPPYIKNIRTSPLTISHKLHNPLFKLLALHTVVIKNCAWIRSLYQLLFWRSRLWNIEMDVQGRWLCAPVKSCSAVRHCVDIRFLQRFQQIFPILVTICMRV